MAGYRASYKIPLYLEWAGIAPTADAVGSYCEIFAAEADPFGGRIALGPRCARVSGEILPGVRLFPHDRHTAGGDGGHLEDTEIDHCFREIHGAPIGKGEAVGSVLSRRHIDAAKSLFIGDSESDLAAAKSNGVRVYAASDAAKCGSATLPIRSASREFHQ